MAADSFAEVAALAGISFTMEPGELLGLIGPNGAGKSTTIKVLTGILHPSGGEATVLGHVPWRERRALAYKIGTVFGQRPQLWYHLPALDTIYLFGKIYQRRRESPAAFGGVKRSAGLPLGSALPVSYTR